MAHKRHSLGEVCRGDMPAAPALGERVIWDYAVIGLGLGLGLRLRAGSPATWIYRRRVDGRVIKRALAKGEAINLSQAREAAKTVARTMASGLSKVSLRDFAATFMRDCAGRWKPLTIEGHLPRGNWSLFFL